MICPSCASQVPPSIWKLVAAFVAAPFAIVAVVALVVVAAVRRGERRLDTARSTSPPRVAERPRDVARLA
jgi:hypothetical protein